MSSEVLQTERIWGSEGETKATRYSALKVKLEWFTFQHLQTDE